MRNANDKHFDQHHSYSREEGYKPVEYVHQEYPKAVADGVVVANEAEEQAYYEEHPELKPEEQPEEVNQFDHFEDDPYGSDDPA